MTVFHSAFKPLFKAFSKQPFLRNSLSQSPSKQSLLKKPLLKTLLIWISGLIFTVIIGFTAFFSLIAINSQGKFYQNIFIDNLPVGGLSQTEALSKLPPNKPLTSFAINISINDDIFATSSASLEPQLNYDEVIKEAYNFGREKNLFTRIKNVLSLNKAAKHFSTQYKFNQNKIKQLFEILKNQSDDKPELASAQLKTSNNSASLVINPGKTTHELELDKNIQDFNNHLTAFANVTDFTSKQASFNFKAETKITNQALSATEIQAAKQRASLLVGKQVKLQANQKIVVLNDQELIELLNFPQGYKENKIMIIFDDLAEAVNRPAQNAIFSFNETTKIVSEFVPDKEGIELDKIASKNLLINLLEKLEQQGPSLVDNPELDHLEVAIKTSSPEITLAETNGIGIKELIGFGESYYNHSIPNRIYNVALAADKINHTLVAPGKEFYFNQTLGPVNKETGFKEAYVIRNNSTELDYGGGVCQVSSTLFRALLDSGLQITRRIPHTYRVSYYELNNDPGFDATVFTGNTDLRFINDTDNYVLINTYTDSKNLYMYVEIYGTSDGRTTQISDYKKWDYQSPPPTIYQPDPSLPSGTLKKIENAIAGIKTKFTHTVRDANGEMISQKEYVSNYQAWPAVYLQGI